MLLPVIEAVAIAVAVNSIIDFIVTAGNLTCLQAETVMTSGRLGMPDKDILSNPVRSRSGGVN